MKRATKSSSSATGQIRIISGQWRGRKLPVADAQGLRPTTDRTKETVFNWLMHDVRDAQCLDMFAGSGGLGFEALSRYAAYCDFIEQAKVVAKGLKNNVDTLQANANVHIGSALEVVKGLKKQYDIVFIDPPFQQNLVAPSLAVLERSGVLKNGSLVYIEHEAGLVPDPISSKYEIVKDKSTSQLRYVLAEYIGE